mmetsp:Transcript_38910/g.122564  ORF Transcript_38910/g.122564 Transcript_38910/m.122564 type:complete len:227 (-) Transcript_38910:58-738(-)
MVSLSLLHHGLRRLPGLRRLLALRRGCGHHLLRRLRRLERGLARRRRLRLEDGDTLGRGTCLRLCLDPALLHRLLHRRLRLCSHLCLRHLGGGGGRRRLRNLLLRDGLALCRRLGRELRQASEEVVDHAFRLLHHRVLLVYVNAGLVRLEHGPAADTSSFARAVCHRGAVGEGCGGNYAHADFIRDCDCRYGSQSCGAKYLFALLVLLLCCHSRLVAQRASPHRVN